MTLGLLIPLSIPNLIRETVYADEIDVTQSWTFNNPSDYTLSDDDLVEVSANSARF